MEQGKVWPVWGREGTGEQRARPLSRSGLPRPASPLTAQDRAAWLRPFSRDSDHRDPDRQFWSWRGRGGAGVGGGAEL